MQLMCYVDDIQQIRQGIDLYVQISTRTGSSKEDAYVCALESSGAGFMHMCVVNRRQE